MFVSIIVLLLILSIITTIANLTIVYKLKLLSGNRFIQFTSSNDAIFSGKVYFKHIYLNKNEIRNITKLTGNISFEVGSSRLSVNENGVTIKAKNGLKVHSSITGKQLFPPDFNNIPIPALSSLSVPGGIKNVHKIRSPTNRDLIIESSNNLQIIGSEGVKMDSKTINLHGSTINLSSANGSIIFQGEKGIFIDPSKLPFSSDSSDDSKNYDLQSKLCICAKNGKIFKLKLLYPDQGCSDVRFPESSNPCS